MHDQSRIETTRIAGYRIIVTRSTFAAAVRRLGLLVLLTIAVFSVYAGLFIISSRSYAVLQTMSVAFDATTQELIARRLESLGDSLYYHAELFSQAGTASAIRRFQRLSALLWFKEAARPSEILAEAWRRWEQADADQQLALRKGSAQAAASIDVQRNDLIIALLGANDVLARIGDRVHTAYDLIFLFFGLLFSFGMAGSVAFYSGLRQSRLKEQFARDTFRLSLEAEERTRKGVAMELHDDLAQDIAAARMLCERAGATGDRALARDAAALLVGVNTKMRGLSSELRPAELDASGLGVALRSLCQDIEKKTRYRIRFVGEEAVPRLPEFVELNAYRIMREAVANAFKYANRGGATLSCTLKGTIAGGIALVLEVCDEGFDEEDAAPRRAQEPRGSGLGLRAMRERADSIGAVLTIAIDRAGSRVALELVYPNGG